MNHYTYYTNVFILFCCVSSYTFSPKKMSSFTFSSIKAFVSGIMNASDNDYIIRILTLSYSKAVSNHLSFNLANYVISKQ